MSTLPHGVQTTTLIPHFDERGWVMEIFSPRFDVPYRQAQWNAVWNVASTMRGVHVHYDHDDYLTVPVGRAEVGLIDLRLDSPTSGTSTVLSVGQDAPMSVFIPPGVGHGFYFPVDSLHVYSMSEAWDPDDDDGCHWSDPDLGLTWSVEDPVLSDRDASAGSLNDLIELVRARGM